MREGLMKVREGPMKVHEGLLKVHEGLMKVHEGLMKVHEGLLRGSKGFDDAFLGHFVAKLRNGSQNAKIYLKCTFGVKIIIFHTNA